jgi:hypothetical protein
MLVKRACDKLSIPCVANRMAIITQPTNGRAPVPLLRRMRARVHFSVELFVEARCRFSRDENGRVKLITARWCASDHE